MRSSSNGSAAEPVAAAVESSDDSQDDALPRPIGPHSQVASVARLGRQRSGDVTPITTPSVHAH
jgi:hypothetical protein